MDNFAAYAKINGNMTFEQLYNCLKMDAQFLADRAINTASLPEAVAYARQHLEITGDMLELPR